MNNQLIGRRFGRLLVRNVIAGADRNGWRLWLFECDCDCGQQTTVPKGSLTGGRTLSCGCFRREVSSVINLKHGREGTAEYGIWNAMKMRCTNPRTKSYRNYGGRGISVCDRWMKSFDAFFADMGPRPSKHLTLERVDNEGNYEPSNCIWATRVQQRHNQRRVYQKSGVSK